MGQSGLIGHHRTIVTMGTQICKAALNLAITSDASEGNKHIINNCCLPQQGDSGKKLYQRLVCGECLIKRGDITPPGVSVISHYKPFENLAITKTQGKADFSDGLQWLIMPTPGGKKSPL